MRANSVPVEFAALWSATSTLLSPSVPTRVRGSLVLLPRGLRPVAEHVESGETFKAFASYLRSTGVKLEDWKLARILRRTGFYQAIQHSGSLEAAWQVFHDNLPPRTASVRTLILLDGCRFPSDRFTVLDRAIQRFSEPEIRELGPQLDVADTFFPNESIDAKWFSQQWFLHWSETREEMPGSVWVWPFGYDVISTSWQPLLALALYKVFPFGAPIVLETQPGWALRRILWSDPWFDLLDVDGEAVEVPTHFYEIERPEFDRFRDFVTFFAAGVEQAKQDRSLRLASRRFLRALFAGGPLNHHGSDSYEDSLLQYVFALEALLTLGEHRAIGKKLAARAAWLIGGRDPAKRERVSTLVTTLYRHRGDIVHGRPADTLDAERGSSRVPLLVQARDLVRQILVVLFALNAKDAHAEEYSRTLADLPNSRSAQHRAMEAASRSLSLVDPHLDPYE